MDSSSPSYAFDEGFVKKMDVLLCGRDFFLYCHLSQGIHEDSDINLIGAPRPTRFARHTEPDGMASQHGILHPHLDHPNQEYRVQLDQDCHGAAWVSVDVGGDQDLIFNMYGVPDSAATLTIRVGNHTRTITVAAETGAVEILE